MKITTVFVDSLAYAGTKEYTLSSTLIIKRINSYSSFKEIGMYSVVVRFKILFSNFLISAKVNPSSTIRSSSFSKIPSISTSIKELVDTYSPDRIIIEPSGVGKLSDIVNAIKDVNLEELKLNILATVVDGPKSKMYLKNFGEFFLNQVEAADTIIISKLDKISNSKIDDVVAIVKEHNDHANIITTPIDEFDSVKLLSLLEEKNTLREQLLLETMKEVHHHDDCCCHEHHHHDHEDCCCHEHHHEHHHHDHEDCCCHEHHHEHHHHDHECCCGHHHDADEVFKSWGKETARTISYDELNHFLNALTNEELGLIVRCKGILKASDKDTWYYFDYVSGEYEIREGSPDYTGRIVVIGANLNEEKVEKLFFER